MDPELRSGGDSGVEIGGPTKCSGNAKVDGSAGCARNSVGAGHQIKCFRKGCRNTSHRQTEMKLQTVLLSFAGRHFDGLLHTLLGSKWGQPPENHLCPHPPCRPHFPPVRV